MSLWPSARYDVVLCSGARRFAIFVREVGPAARAQGSVALSHCATAHPLYTSFTTIFGVAISEATMRLRPTRAALLSLGIASGPVSCIMRHLLPYLRRARPSMVSTILVDAWGRATDLARPQVECSGASAAGCAALHRRPCHSSRNTCGRCLPGYVGAGPLPEANRSGWDSNTDSNAARPELRSGGGRRCRPATAPGRRA